MDPTSAGEVDLARRARRAYELGRLRMAARVFYLLVPATCIGLLANTPREELVCVVGLLSTSAIWLRWRGRAGGPAVIPGLIAGFLPLLIAPLAHAAGLVCQGASFSCLSLTVGTGLASGVILGWYASKNTREVLARWSSAAAIASMTACLSCVGLGLWAVLGTVLGIIAGSAVAGLAMTAVHRRR